MASANLHGWEFVLKQDVEVIWDGISDTTSEHVKVISDTPLINGRLIVDTSTANATLTFNLDCFIETDKDHYVVLSGPPNYFIDGAKPMNAVIRSDVWHFSPIQYCWKITTPNKPVLFKKGTPIVFMTNYPVGLLEKTDVIVKPADEKILQESSNYGQNRSSMYGDFNGKNFPLMYKKNNSELLKDSGSKDFKPKPSSPTVEK